MRKAVYAGSFDPITNGHVEIIRRGLIAFDRIVVAVAHNPNKQTALFSVEERVDMCRESFPDLPDRIEVDWFEGLLVDYCKRIGVHVVVRGLRAVSDFEYEFQMAMMNRHLSEDIETLFMSASEEYFYTASRLVKEVVSLGGDVSGLVPDTVLRRLTEKFRSRKNAS